MRKSNFDYFFVYLIMITEVILFRFAAESRRIRSPKSAFLALGFIVLSILALGLFLITFGLSLILGVFYLFPSRFLGNLLLLIVSVYGSYSRSLERSRFASLRGTSQKDEENESSSKSWNCAWLWTSGLSCPDVVLGLKCVFVHVSGAR